MLGDRACVHTVEARCWLPLGEIARRDLFLELWQRFSRQMSARLQMRGGRGGSEGGAEVRTCAHFG
jgi:hypothetical protein